MSLGTSVGALLDRVRRDALLGLHGPLYTLTSGAGASATQLVVDQSVDHLATGSIVAVDTELYFVRSVAGTTVDVIPAALGSSTGTHAAGSIVEVAPRFPKASLVDYVAQELASWTSVLWRVVAVDVALVQDRMFYELEPDGAGDVVMLLDVRAQPPATNDSWSADRWPKVAAQLIRDVPTDVFDSGIGLQLTTYPRHGTSLRVVYAASFDATALDASADLVDDVGLAVSQLEVLEAGCKWRALSDGALSRTDYRSSGMSRQAEEVTVLDMIRAADQAKSRRDMVLAREANELRARWPWQG